MKSLTYFYLLFFTQFSFAEDWLPEFNGLIAGAVNQDDLPYAQVNTQTQPSILIFGRLGEVFIEGNRAGYPIKRFPFGTLSAVGQIRTHQYLDADNTSLTNEDRNRAIEVGPQFTLPISHGYFSQFTLFQDISGQHEAQEFEAAIYKRFIFENFRLITTLAAQYQSKKLMNYYIGTANYQANGEWTQEIELLGVYDINKDWSVTAMWRYYQHGSDFDRSPLTSKNTTSRIAVGIGRHF